MALRTVTLTRKAGKRAPVKMMIGTTPEDVEAVDGASPRKHLRMYSPRHNMFMGLNGGHVRNGGHAQKYNPSQARRFLAKKRTSDWVVC